MPRLDLLVIQEIPPKDRGGWRESVGPEAYNAIQLFMHFFQKTVLDGAGKITIYVGKNPDDKPIYYYSDYFMISSYYTGEETENKRRQLKAEEWDDFYTDLIEKTLIDIAKRAENEGVIPEIKRAISSVRSTGYKLLVPIKKLSKRSPNRMYQAMTYKYLTPQGELDFIEITDKLKEKNKYVISDGYVKFPLEWYASKCEWAENRFVIKDRLDGIRAYVDADTKSMYSLHNKNVKLRTDEYVRSRLEDTVKWSLQTFNVADKEYGYGQPGWMSERFCFCQGLLTEKYPDGSPASTWFALMPWAAASIIEGLAF